jgi:Fructose-2,6-bisphosphatase
MLLFLRHANDKHDGTNDPKLSSKGKFRCFKEAKRLVQKYGKPDVIYCSPFIRAVQTANYLCTALKIKVKIKKRSFLSRYFTSKQKKSPKIPNKLQEKIQINETKKEFKNRVKKSLHRLKDKTKNINCWCITHALFLKEIKKANNIYNGEHIKFLESVKVSR